MIDTYEKLEEVINDPIHKLRIVATAIGEYSDESDDDVWGTYWVSAEDQMISMRSSQRKKKRFMSGPLHYEAPRTKHRMFCR